jgi:hypothetical protein
VRWLNLAGMKMRGAARERSASEFDIGQAGVAVGECSWHWPAAVEVKMTLACCDWQQRPLPPSVTLREDL